MGTGSRALVMAVTGAAQVLLTLPAVGLVSGGKWAFLKGFVGSYRRARVAFRAAPPQAALAMGGFTSAAPLLAARAMRAQ